MARPSSAPPNRRSRAPRGIGSSSLNPSAQGSRSTTPVDNYGSGNEAFFERMGSSNAARPDHLPPSQGGRYGGFGSTPDPSIPTTGGHPSFAMSSQSAPTLEELQRNPLGALSKGWGLFSSAVASAGKEINDTVVRPGIGRASELGGEDWQKYLDNAKQAAGWAGQRAGEGWETINDVARQKGGVDLNEQLGKLGLGQARGGTGYGQLDRAEEGVISPYGGDAGSNDFFDSWADQAGPTSGGAQPVAQGKKNDDWHDADWKDF